MSLFHDLRFAVRLLIKDRWFTLVAALALALGMAANNAVFTFVNAVLLRGLPFKDRRSDHGRSAPATRATAISACRSSTSRTGGPSAQDLLGHDPDGAAHAQRQRGGPPPERYAGVVVSANLFRLIGEKPLLGRDSPPTTIASARRRGSSSATGCGRRATAATRESIGRTIKVDDLHRHRRRRDAGGHEVSAQHRHLAADGTVDARCAARRRQLRNYNVIGRLADGVTPAQAQAELAAIATRLANDYPTTNKDITPRSSATTSAKRRADQDVFWALMGAVAFVLLIACSNVANLLLARAAHRSREISVRVSLGASRWRIVRQLLVESVLLAADQRRLRVRPLDPRHQPVRRRDAGRRQAVPG